MTTEQLFLHMTRKNLPLSFVYRENFQVGEFEDFGAALIEPGNVPEELRDSVQVLDESNKVNAIITTVHEGPGPDGGDRETVDTVLQNQDDLEPKESWKGSSINTSIAGSKEKLSSVYSNLKEVGYYELSDGFKIVHMVPASAFPSEFFLPIVYNGEGDPPSTVLRYSDGFGFLTPVMGARGSQVVATFHERKWEVLDDHLIVTKDEIPGFQERGYHEVKPDLEDHGEVNTETHSVMARQELVKISDVFRGSVDDQAVATAPDQEQTPGQSSIVVAVNTSFSPNRQQAKKQKTAGMTEYL